MDVRDRLVDVELTNRCNALCSFCPRDETPDQGFMSMETFVQVIERVKELESIPRISFTGQGESTLHPDLVAFVRYAKSQGVIVQMTSNGSLLDDARARALLDAGLDGICFSISDMGEDYELVYNLDFERTHSNVLHFLELAKQVEDRQIEVMLSIVRHDLNRDKFDEMSQYWQGKGITTILPFDQNNRGGACDNGHYFTESDRFTVEARQIMAEARTSTLCSAPFYFIFIGWSGQYYICCSDYRKISPLGSVFDYSIDAMDAIKLKAFSDRLPACAQCDFDPLNAVREKLFEIEAGEKTRADLDKLMMQHRKFYHQRLPRDIDILDWEPSASSSLIAVSR
ncbi:radical SAM protein [Parahaliea maris]|nr:radical SAM/SPASM domain-containing protein [Parahaliea maris]